MGRKIHGEANTRLYTIWNCMNYRCNPKSKHAERKIYGGRGISVCSEWRSYPKFKAWALENGYADELTIERIDNNGDYEPSNCTWIPREEQSLNKSNSVYVDVSLPLVSVCRQFNLPYESTRKRVHRGQDINEIIRKRKIKHGRKNV